MEIAYTELVNVTDVGQTVTAPAGLGRTEILGWELSRRSGNPIIAVPGILGTAVDVTRDRVMLVLGGKDRDYANVRAAQLGLRCAAGQSGSVVVKFYATPRGVP